MQGQMRDQQAAFETMFRGTQSACFGGYLAEIVGSAVCSQLLQHSRPCFQSRKKQNRTWAWTLTRHSPFFNIINSSTISLKSPTVSSINWKKLATPLKERLEKTLRAKRRAEQMELEIQELTEAKISKTIQIEVWAHWVRPAPSCKCNYFHAHRKKNQMRLEGKRRNDFINLSL